MNLQLKFVPKKKLEISVAEVERLAASGLSQGQIADALKIPYSTFSRRLNQSLTLKTALKRGTAAATRG